MIQDIIKRRRQTIPKKSGPIVEVPIATVQLISTYIGLGSMSRKIERLLSDFAFVPVNT